MTGTNVGVMPKPAANIHDAFFKKVLGDAESAGAFLREHLPPDVAELLGPEPPERVESSFVDEGLAQHQSDLLFRVHLRTGNAPAFAYVLMEHKSAPDPLARLQLLRYVVRILVSWYEQNKQLPLPPVLPLLAHHGPKGWQLSCEFADLFGDVATPLRQYLPSFRHELVDLGRIDDGALSAQVRLRAFLKALKYSLRPDLPTRLDIILAEGSSLELVDLVLILTYFDKGPAAVSDEQVRCALQRLVPDRENEIMTLFGQKHFNEGVAKGRTEGEANALARLLERRFGSVSNRDRERILSADLTSLQTWFERAIDAPDLTSVFRTN
jgi:predicted transposase/invertase (TIGR01784 family)